MIRTVSIASLQRQSVIKVRNLGTGTEPETVEEYWLLTSFQCLLVLFSKYYLAPPAWGGNTHNGLVPSTLIQKTLHRHTYRPGL